MLAWKNYLLADKEQYHIWEEGSLATIQDHAWCDWPLYVLHWFIRRRDTDNDVKILMNAPLRQDILKAEYKLTSRDQYKLIEDSTERRKHYVSVVEVHPN